MFRPISASQTYRPLQDSQQGYIGMRPRAGAVASAYYTNLAGTVTSHETMTAGVLYEFDPVEYGGVVTVSITSGEVDVSTDLLSSDTVRLTASQIASPTAAILADTTATYIGPSPDYVRYRSDGASLIDDSLTTTLISGELQQFNRLAGGSIASYSNKTADGVIAAAPCICYGYIVTVAMSAAVTNVYDNASAASGTILFVIPASTAVGVYAFNTGVLCGNGLYADFVGTGTVNFLYVPTGG